MWFLLVLILGIVVLGIWMWKRPDPVQRDQAKAVQHDLWIEQLDAQLKHAERLSTDVQPNYARAYEIYEELAKQQELPQAYVGMALMHLKGQGREQSTEHALRYLENAFRLGSEDAAYHLGKIYDSEQYQCNDAEKAVYWYRHAVARGSLDAQYRITEINEQEHNDEYAAQQKLQLLKQNADQGHSNSQFQLAEHHLKQANIRNISEGIHYLFLAAQQDHLAANQWIAQLYEHGEFLSEDPKQALLYKKHCVSLGDHSQLYDYYAGVLLGWIDVDQRQRVIQHLQHQSYEEKNAQAKTLIGLAHFYGWYVDQNETMAYGYWLEAAQFQHPRAVCIIAALNLEEYLVDEPSQSYAFELYQKATQLDPNDFYSHMGVALCHLNGTGVMKDTVKATQMIQVAAKQYLNIEAKSEADLIYCVGRFYAQVDYPLVNKDKAVQYLNQAVSKGSEEAAWYLYQAFSGLNAGFEVNDDLAKRYIHQAAQLGSVRAQATLGQMYLNGESVEQDHAMGFNYLQKAASKQNAEALNALGEALEHGLGIAPNLEQALRFYQKAAEGANPDAYSHLGRLYTKGIGVERDINTAREWLEKGSSMGHEPSIELLNNLNAYLQMKNQL